MIATYDLYREGLSRVMFAIPDGESRLFDGGERMVEYMDIETTPYGRMVLESVSSILPRAHIVCHTSPPYGLYEGTAKLIDLILDQTEEPLIQVLRYLNGAQYQSCYRVDVEIRACCHDQSYGMQTEFITLPGSLPHDYAWMYQGATKNTQWWLPEEQLPIDAVLRQHLPNRMTEFWKFVKKEHEGQHWYWGIHFPEALREPLVTYTPEKLANRVEQQIWEWKKCGLY